MLINLKNLSKQKASKDLYENVNLSVSSGQKIACVGPNGSGKSTLIKLITGAETPDTGEVKINPDVRISYMPQDYRPSFERTVQEAVKELCGLKPFDDQLADSANLSEEKLSQLLADYESAGGYEFDHKLAIMLEAFGLPENSGETKIQSLSGGQKSKVMLIATLLRSSDLLILDEPTNNLDLPAIIWLQQFLQSVPQAVLLVSHDVVFLDAITDIIWEIDPNKKTIKMERGLVSALYERRALQIQSDLRTQYIRDEEIKRLDSQADQLRNKSAAGSKHVGSDNDKFLRGFRRNSAGASGKKAKQLEDRVEDLKTEPRISKDKKVSFDFGDDKSKSDSTVASAHEVTFGYGQNPVLDDVSLIVSRGERVLILGPNGAGKTTLVDLLAGKIEPQQGSVYKDKSAVWFTLDQDQSQVLSAKTPADFLHEKTGIPLSKIHTILASVGISYELSTSSPEHLSPGQRVKFMLTAAGLVRAGVLVLDEPTNHLDQVGFESLLFALSDFGGTVLLISHDRKLLGNFQPTHSYLLNDGKIQALASLDSYLSEVESAVRRLINKL